MASKRDSIDGVGDVIDLVKAYAQQELVGPLRHTGRFVGFGIVGALMLGLGLLLLAVGLLRMLQVEFPDAFDGWGSVLPYAIVLATIVVAMALIGLRMTKGIDE